MVEKCCFLFSRVSHRDPKVEPAGLGSGAAPRSWRSPRVWRQSTVACDFTLGPDPSNHCAPDFTSGPDPRVKF